MSAGASDAFNPRLIIGVVAAAVVAFIALWALIALGPQLSSGDNGRGHALSRGAAGYAGLVDLLERSDASVDVRRKVMGSGEIDSDWRELLVLTPPHDADSDDIAALVKAHDGGAVLIVLPKWRAGAHETKRGWSGPGLAVRPRPDLIPKEVAPIDALVRSIYAEDARAKLNGLNATLAVPLPDRAAQAIKARDLDTLLAAPHGDGALLVKHPVKPIFVLSDPDLVNNRAFSSRERARAAALLIDAIATQADVDGVAFDVTLNGLGGNRSLLRHAFVPPFLGVTLCLIAAALFALWQAAVRFGPALVPARAIPISKRALIDSSADLVKQAGRELDGAYSWINDLRAVLAQRLHAPADLTPSERDAWIDRLVGPEHERFSTLARRLPLARNAHELVTDAQALHRIRKDLLRDH